jgi:trehalose 6-phosphate phosphatase
MTEFWRRWPEARGRLRRARRRILFLDFDGTLAPIAPRPGDVRLGAGTRAALGDLARRPRWRVVVTSGRSLKDVGRFVGRLPVYLVGNHGLETRDPGRGPRAAGPGAARRKGLRAALRRFRSVLRAVPGAWVEDKGLTASVHFRNVPARHRGGLRRALAALRGELPPGFEWRRGKETWEIRPAGGGDKGKAARRFLRRFPEALAVAVGDDRTDEDLFRALPRGAVTVRVGRRRGSSARYYLASQRHVPAFLKALREV